MYIYIYIYIYICLIACGSFQGILENDATHCSGVLALLPVKPQWKGALHCVGSPGNASARGHTEPRTSSAVASSAAASSAAATSAAATSAAAASAAAASSSVVRALCESCLLQQLSSLVQAGGKSLYD